MATQLVQPDLGVKGPAGWCLSVAEDVWHVPHDYKSAIEAWNNSSSTNHPNEQPPANVCVVLYWTYYDRVDKVWYGHVATWVPGQGIYSSPFNVSFGSEWYPSVQAMTDRINSIPQAQSQYLGWSESLAGVQLVDMNDQVQLAGNQRVVSNGGGVNGRSAATTDAPVVKEFNKDDVLDFKGYVRGQDPYGNGNNIWFVGAYSNTYWYSGSFSNTSTNGLNDITPVVPLPADTVPPESEHPHPLDDPSYHLVANKKHPLDKDFAPTDLVVIGATRMRSAAADMIKAMQKDSGDDIYIIPQSGYRSYSDQEAVYAGYDPSTRDTFSARAGYSEHQTGLAIDFNPIDDAFKNTAQYKWLLANARHYGFVLRYPSDKTAITGYEYEPWHWRYIGPAAEDMAAKGVTTLEEYYNVEGGGYPIVQPTPTPVDPTPAPPEKDYDKENYSLLQQIIAILKKIFNIS